MFYKNEIIRWSKGTIAFALGMLALWRSVSYVDPNPSYPAFASVMCGICSICLVITGLGIVTDNSSESPD